MTTPPSLPAIVVAAIITDGNGRILINQRPPDSRHAGKWEFPGGKVEPGEDPRDALERECLEELGCTVRAGAIYETIFHAYPGHSVLLLFYLAEILEGRPRPLEQNRLAWTTAEEMAAYDLLEADRPLPALFQQRYPHFQREYLR